MPVDNSSGSKQLISVILPNRNHGTHLRRSIPGLLAQTYAELEIVVVDDGSTDDSCIIIEAFAAADPRVRLLRLGQHVGVTRAVMRGAEEVRGAYIYCAAADDLVTPHFFEHSLSALSQFNSSAFCFSDPTELYEDGTHCTFPLFLRGAVRSFSPGEVETMLRHNYFHFSSNTIIYRRARFMEAGGFRADLDWLADWFIANVLALRYGACYVPEPLTYFSIRPGSYSAVNLRRTAQQRDLFFHVLTVLRESQFADVWLRFRQAALLPEYRFRDIIWLARSKQNLNYLSVRLAARILARGAWHYMRMFVPVAWRRQLRRLASNSVR